MSSDYDYNADYDPIILQFINKTDNNPNQHVIKMAYFITYCVVLILGVTLNFFIIVISCRTTKSGKKVAVWIMALASTHLVSCASVTCQLLYAYNNFEWKYGKVSCKLSSYITYGNMFSTATILSFWSISSTLSKSICIRNCKNFNIILISLAWTIAAVLACPSLFSREVRNLQCIDDYDMDKSKTTEDGITRLKVVVVMRFLLGVLVPALIMFLSCCIASTRRGCSLCRKQTEIICALKIVYFVCWSPQMFLTMLQATVSGSLGENMTRYGLPGVTMLATTHCFINPLIYPLLGCSIKMNWMMHDPDQCDHSDVCERFPLGTQTENEV